MPEGGRPISVAIIWITFIAILEHVYKLVFQIVNYFDI